MAWLLDTNVLSEFIIDLARVAKVDCAALGELIGYHTDAGAAGISVALTNVTQRIRNLLVITEPVTVFQILEDESAGSALTKAA